MLETRVSAVPTVAYRMVLRHHVSKPPVCQTSTKLLHCQVWGHRSLVRVCSSVITEVRNTKTNGSTNIRPTATATACTAIHSSTGWPRLFDAGLATLMVAISVLRQEAGAPAHQQRREDHGEPEQDEGDHARGADVEPMEAEVVDQLGKGERRTVRVPRLG